MAGPARDLSKPGSRAHRGGVRRQQVVLPHVNDLDTPPPPAGVTFTAAEREAWGDLWSTGESTQWSDAQLVPVAVLVVLSSKIWAGKANSADLASVDRLMAALGLTPSGRARLGWEVSP